MKIRMSIICMLLSVPFILQGYLTDVEPLEIFVIASRILSFCIIAIWYFVIRRQISRIMIALLLFLFSLFISTYINKDGSYLRYFQFCITTLGFCMLTEIMLKKDFQALCLGILVPTSILAVINIISILLFPDGLSLSRNEPSIANYWFLGYYNAHVLLLYPVMYISLLHAYYMRGRMSAIAFLLILLSSVTIFIIWSATSVITITIFLLFIPVLMNMKDGRIFNFRNYCIATVLFFVAVVVFRIQEHFLDIIEYVLRRSETLTGRGLKWNHYISYIQLKPFIGHGFEDMVAFTTKHGVTNAHNLYLEILYIGGTVAILLFIVMLIMAGRRLMKYRGNKLAFILSFVFFIYSIRFLAESHMVNPRFIFMWFILAYHIGDIIMQHDTNKLDIPCSALHSDR